MAQTLRLFEPGPDDPLRGCSRPPPRCPRAATASRSARSHGWILLPTEAWAPAEALLIADQRMYAQKHAGRMSAGRQSKDVLPRALAARNQSARRAPRRRRRADRPPARPAEGGGRAPRHAGELHDAGKVAIPDGILAGPGPLTDDEWAFIRRHPLIGERIVRSAPSLSRVAGLVRSTHERWDGAGHPDKLAGDAIPPRLRIVAVAGAYDAMTSERPYAAPGTPQEALEDLRRHSGTQFDPAIVETFRAVVAESTLELAA